MDIQKSTLQRIWSRLPLLALILLVLLAIALGVSIKDKKQALEDRKKAEAAGNRTPVNVVTLKLIPGVISDRINLPATVEAREDLQIKAQLDGVVVETSAREGSRVSKGDVIARIDPRDYEIALSGAEASHDQAFKALKRAERLLKKSIISENEYDIALANEKTLKARLDKARLDLERTEITSPISGVLNRLDAKVGNLMSPGSPVAQVLDVNPVKVVVGIPESDVTSVRRVKEFHVTLNALDDKRFRGKKHFISSQPNSQAHLYRLEILLPNPRSQILPGMFARVDILKEEITDGLSVPLYAIITQADKHFVYIEENGAATRRNVETGILEGWQMQITKGLMPGDNVMVVGHRSVAEGQPVNVIREVSDPSALLK